MNKSLLDKVYHFEHSASRIVWNKHQDMVMDYMHRSLAHGLEAHISRRYLREESSNHMIRNFVDLIIASPEEYWEDVHHMAEQIALQYGRILP